VELLGLPIISWYFASKATKAGKGVKSPHQEVPKLETLLRDGSPQ